MGAITNHLEVDDRKCLEFGLWAKEKRRRTGGHLRRVNRHVNNIITDEDDVTWGAMELENILINTFEMTHGKMKDVRGMPSGIVHVKCLLFEEKFQLCL